jgi:hypothetical protein
MTDGMKEIMADFEGSMEGKPDYALHAIGLAELALRKKDELQAFELARKALAGACGNAEVFSRASELLGSLVPGYHVPMMNDARRNAVWDRALRNAIRPGMHVLEIGTGGGMLALMAARAGAAKVTSCERDPIVAAIAREIVERNGYGDRIEIVGKPSQAIRVDDLAPPADLLFCISSATASSTSIRFRRSRMHSVCSCPALPSYQLQAASALPWLTGKITGAVAAPITQRISISLRSRISPRHVDQSRSAIRASGCARQTRRPSTLTLGRQPIREAAESNWNWRSPLPVP